MKRKRQQPPTLSLLHRLVIHDPKTGEVISDSGLQPSFSFLLNWLLALRSLFIQDRQWLTNTAGAAWETRDASLMANIAQVNAPAANTAFGILAGTATTPVAHNDHRLITPIPHGAAAGQLSYAAVTDTPPAFAAPNLDYVVSRILTNLSGAAITINEIGLIGFFSGSLPGTANILLARDVVAPTAVPHGTSITLSYTVRSMI